MTMKSPSFFNNVCLSPWTKKNVFPLLSKQEVTGSPYFDVLTVQCLLTNGLSGSLKTYLILMPDFILKGVVKRNFQILFSPLKIRFASSRNIKTHKKRKSCV